MAYSCIIFLLIIFLTFIILSLFIYYLAKVATMLSCQPPTRTQPLGEKKYYYYKTNDVSISKAPKLTDV